MENKLLKNKYEVCSTRNEYITMKMRSEYTFDKYNNKWLTEIRNLLNKYSKQFTGGKLTVK